MKQTDKRRPYFYTQWPLLTVLLILGIGAVQAANTQTGQKPPISASTALQAKIDAVTARQDFDETTKTSVLKFYHSAQDNLANIELFNSKTESFKQATKQAPEAIKKLQKDLEQIQQKQAKQKPESFTDIATDELEQRLIIEKEKLSNLDEQLKNLDTELTLQNSRPPLIRQETLTAQQDLDNSQKKSASPATSTTLKIESEAEQLYLKTLIDARTAELKMLDIEAISNPVRVDLLKAQYQLLDSQRSMEAPILTAIDSILAERRLQAAKEAQDALSQAEKDLAGKHLVIQMLTRENIQFSKDLQATTSKTDAYNEQEAKLDSQVTEIDNDFKSAEKKKSVWRA